MSTFTAHLADDAKPTTTLCGLPWEDWQDPDQGAPLEDVLATVATQRAKAEIRAADASIRPQHGGRIEQCQACLKASFPRI